MNKSLREEARSRVKEARKDLISKKLEYIAECIIDKSDGGESSLLILVPSYMRKDISTYLDKEGFSYKVESYSEERFTIFW